MLRLNRHDKPHVLAVLARVVDALAAERVGGRLWIVEEERLRIRGEGDGSAT